MSFHDSILPLQGNSTQPLQAHPALSTASFRSPGIRHIDSSSLELFTSALLLGPPLLHRNTHSQNIFTFTFVTFSFSLAQPSQNISSPSTSSFLCSILSSQHYFSERAKSAPPVTKCKDGVNESTITLKIIPKSVWHVTPPLDVPGGLLTRLWGRAHDKDFGGAEKQGKEEGGEKNAAVNFISLGHFLCHTSAFFLTISPSSAIFWLCSSPTDTKVMDAQILYVKWPNTVSFPYPQVPCAQIQEVNCTVITLHSCKISFFPQLSMVLWKLFSGNNGYITFRHKNAGAVVVRQEDQSLALLGRDAIQIACRKSCSQTSLDGHFFF